MEDIAHTAQGFLDGLSFGITGYTDHLDHLHKMDIWHHRHPEVMPDDFFTEEDWDPSGPDQAEEADRGQQAEDQAAV